MNFGEALERCKEGSKIYRDGWNGKGMFVVYQKGYPDGIQCNAQTAKAWGLQEGDLFKCEPYLQIKMANGSHAMWVPSINDVLSTDWVIDSAEENCFIMSTVSSLKYDENGHYTYTGTDGSKYYSTDGATWTPAPTWNAVPKDEANSILQVKNGYVQMVLLPVKIIDGCVSNVR